VYEISV
jgi:hypothetical protein